MPDAVEALKIQEDIRKLMRGGYQFVVISTLEQELKKIMTDNVRNHSDDFFVSLLETSSCLAELKRFF